MGEGEAVNCQTVMSAKEKNKVGMVGEDFSRRVNLSPRQEGRRSPGGQLSRVNTCGWAAGMRVGIFVE